MLKKINILPHAYFLMLFSLFPLLPNRVKGIPVILLFLSAVFLKRKSTRAYPLKQVLLLSSLFIVLLLGLLYTSNWIEVDKLLSTRLALLAIPISFGFYVSKGKRVAATTIHKVLEAYINITTLFSVLIIGYMLYLGVFTDKNVHMVDIMKNLTDDMFLIHQHPIYSSIFIGLASLFSLILFLRQKEKAKRNVLFFFIKNTILLTTLFLLSRKGVLLAFFISTIFSLYFLVEKKMIRRGIIVALLLLILISWKIPTIKSRFAELFRVTTYQKVDENISTSIRVAVYKCALKKIQESPLFGYGFADVNIELQHCYLAEGFFKNETQYNSHNQYLSYQLSTGILGFLTILYVVFCIFRRGFQKKQLFLLGSILFFSVLMLFENILERQSGVILFSFFISLFYFNEKET